MARPLRVEYPGAVYYVTNSGNGQQDIFLCDSDYELFLEVLADTIERFEWICHAYCLLPDHYHFLVETPQANLSRGMRRLNWSYTQAFNHRYIRSGHVFRGRFKAILVEKGAPLLELARHVVLNPVRVEVARSANNWQWSSYRATAGMTPCPPFLTVNWILARLDVNSRRAVELYRKSVRRDRGTDIWDDLRGGVLLGSDKFVARLKPLLSRE